MLKVEKQRKRLTPLRVMPPGSLANRYDLAELISNSPSTFFTETQLELFVISSKLSVSDAMPLQVDLLALDKEGRGVIVVTRHGNKQADLATPIACAALIAQWTPEEVFEQLPVERQEALKIFLHVGVDAINREQSVILVAEDYNDKELTAVKWLREQHGIDIRCFCIVTAVDSEQNEYLSCRNLTETSLATHPTVELNSESVQSSSISSEISISLAAVRASAEKTKENGIKRDRLAEEMAAAQIAAINLSLPKAETARDVTKAVGALLELAVGVVLEPTQDKGTATRTGVLLGGRTSTLEEQVVKPIESESEMDMTVGSAL